MRIVFKGPRDKDCGATAFSLFFILFSIINLVVSNPFGFWSGYKSTLVDFLGVESMIILMTSLIWYIYYKTGKRYGYFENDAYILKISNEKIESIIKELGKIHHRLIYANNIKRMKYKRDVGGTGHKIKIWPKNYDILAESGFEFGKGVLEYFKKHGTPVILYPPAMGRKERKRLKEAIEEFKKENGIE